MVVGVTKGAKYNKFNVLKVAIVQTNRFSGSLVLE